MRQEQINIQTERCRSFIQRIEPDLLQDSIPCRAEFARTSVPVPWNKRSSLNYRAITEGEEWGEAWDSAWFHLQAELPKAWNALPVALRLNLSGENLLFDADGVPLMGLTAYSVLNPDYTKEFFRLPEAFRKNGQFELWLEAAASSNFGVYLVDDPHRLTTRTQGWFAAKVETMRVGVFHQELWHLQIEFGVLLDYYNALPEDDYRRRRVLGVLSGAIDAYADNPVNATAARNILAPILKTPAMASSSIVCGVGHAHLDTGWLWPVSETIRKSARTFANQLDMMDKYPEYRFGASQPQHYAFVKEYYPELFEKIRRRVAEGRWELQGGMWVEADCNLISGESMIRQFLHGKNFFMDEFGIEVRNLWLPDVFGYSPAMPQIIRKSGCDYFLTQKISWSQFNRFPYTTFFWRGIDNTEVLTHFPPENTYNAMVTPRELIPAQNRFQESDALPEFLSLFGIGNGGGGPQEEHIERARLLADLEGVPKFRFGRADEFFDHLAQSEAVTCHQLPTWSGELYLEMHRGTLTTQSRVKRDNRKLEQLLIAIEFLAAMGPLEKYPVAALDGAWKKLMLNQFHDILPGSSITRVYKDTHREHAELFQLCGELLERAIIPVSCPEADTLSLVNTLSAEWCHAVKLPTTWENCEIFDESGALVTVQEDRARCTIPASGVAVWHKGIHRPAAITIDDSLVLENDLVRYEFTKDGELKSAIDRETGLETLRPGETGNKFKLYVDRPNTYEAWDIDIFYDHEKTFTPELRNRSPRRIGNVDSSLKFEWQIGDHSTIRQTIRLEHHSKRLDFETEVDWFESRRMLRVSFPTAIAADSAACDIQYGYVRRSTHENTSWDMAKFEVVFHRYVDFSEPCRGTALLSDCKYGCRINRGNLDLCLLRSPKYPDWEADQGVHYFCYSFLPHTGNLTNSNVMAEAAQLNRTPLLFPDRRITIVPPFQVERGSVSLEVLKQSEKGRLRIIRLVEYAGSTDLIQLKTMLSNIRLVETDLLEWRDGENFYFENGTLSLTFHPFEIRTFKVEQELLS